MNSSKVGNLIIEELSGQYGLGLAAEPYDKNKTRYLRISDIDDSGNLLNSDLKSVSGEGIENYLLEENDFVVARTGNSTGRTYVYSKEDGAMAYAGFLIKYVFDDKRINPRYMKYYPLSSIYKKQIAGYSGSTRGNMNAQDFKNIIVIYPDRQKQDDMVTLLDSITKKIANNNKISAELEGLAKTIYDYWFLQFEFPNEEGKPYKSFGGKMVYNEELKREIPEGWMVRSIKDCIEHINTGLNPRDNFVLNDKKEVKYITVKNLTTEGTLDFSGCDYISFKTKELVNRRSQIQKGDILFASIAPLGRCYLIEETPKDWEINESVFSIRPDLDTISAEYLYMFFMSDWFIKKAEHSSTGSVFSGIRVSVLEDTKILVPDEVTTKRFSEKVSSIMNIKFNKEKENQQLASLRDWLLPMLMNGQVAFKESL